MEIPCIHCGERTVYVDIENADLCCDDCGKIFTVDDIRGIVKAWNLIIPWLLAHPSKPAPVHPI